VLAPAAIRSRSRPFRQQTARRRAQFHPNARRKAQKRKRVTMKILFAALAMLLITSSTSNAEIMCTERGCWETGRIIRLLPGDRGGDATFVNRNGKGTINLNNAPIVNDTPHQTAAPTRRRK
jgi:hypothetical protein